MQFIRHPDKFCEDSKPYWILFLCFIFCCIMLLGTLYTRQPERYRRISRWLTADSSSSTGPAQAQAAAFYNPGGPGGGEPGMQDGIRRAVQPEKGAALAPGSTKRIIEFGGMTLGDAAPNQARKEATGSARYGVEILRIDKTSVTYLSGMRRGDVIMSVNRLPTYTVDDFERVVQTLDTSQGVLFDVYRNGRSYYMTVETRNAARW